MLREDRSRVPRIVKILYHYSGKEKNCLKGGKENILFSEERWLRCLWACQEI